jgi:hypothetical protein
MECGKNDHRLISIDMLAVLTIIPNLFTLCDSIPTNLLYLFATLSRHWQIFCICLVTFFSALTNLLYLSRYIVSALTNLPYFFCYIVSALTNLLYLSCYIVSALTNILYLSRYIVSALINLLYFFVTFSRRWQIFCTISLPCLGTDTS